MTVEYTLCLHGFHVTEDCKVKTPDVKGYTHTALLAWWEISPKLAVHYQTPVKHLRS